MSRILTDEEIGILLDARATKLGVDMEDMRGPHVAFVDERYMYTDDAGNDVHADPRDIMCGTQHWGDRVMCEFHEYANELWYPQGWRYYPGDVCRHGTYVGGCGIDWMCGPCELGEDEDDILTDIGDDDE